MYTRKHTLAEIFKVFGRSNWIFLVIGIILTVLVLDREIRLFLYDLTKSAPDFKPNSELEFYRDWSVVFWVTAYCSVLYVFWLPLYRVKNHPFGYKLSVIAIVIASILLIIIVGCGYFRLGAIDNGAGLVGAIVTATISMLILFVKVQMDSLVRRSANSLQALLQMRMSEVYQRHVENINVVYPSHDNRVITESDIALVINSSPVIVMPEERSIDDEPSEPRTTGSPAKDSDSDISQNGGDMEAKIIQAIRSQVYILNYFEFLALGVKNFVLDEELLYESLGGIFVNSYKRAEFIVEGSGDSKSYILIKEMYLRWSSRRKAEVKALDQK